MLKLHLSSSSIYAAKFLTNVVIFALLISMQSRSTIYFNIPFFIRLKSYDWFAAMYNLNQMWISLKLFKNHTSVYPLCIHSIKTNLKWATIKHQVFCCWCYGDNEISAKNEDKSKECDKMHTMSLKSSLLVHTWVRTFVCICVV